jgi:hypothetical protein
MRGRRARIVVDALLGLEDLDRETLARQRECGNDDDGTAAGDDDGTF